MTKKKLGKHPTSKELKEHGISRKQHELMYSWFENGCCDYRNMDDSAEDDDDYESDVYVKECEFTTSTKESGIGII